MSCDEQRGQCQHDPGHANGDLEAGRASPLDVNLVCLILLHGRPNRADKLTCRRLRTCAQRHRERRLKARTTIGSVGCPDADVGTRVIHLQDPGMWYDDRPKRVPYRERLCVEFNPRIPPGRECHHGEAPHRERDDNGPRG